MGFHFVPFVFFKFDCINAFSIDFAQSISGNLVTAVIGIQNNTNPSKIQNKLKPIGFFEINQIVTKFK